MHKISSTLIIVMMIFVSLPCICSAQSKHPDLDDVMNKVRGNLNSLKSYILKVEGESVSNVSLTGNQKWWPRSLNGNHKSNFIQEVRYDGERFSFRRSKWGDLDPFIRDVPKESMLDKYVATQKKIYGSFIAEYEIIKDDYKNYDFAIEKGRRKRGEDTIVRWDGERFYWSQKNWGSTYPSVADYVPRDDPRHSAHLWDGKKFYMFGREPDYKLKESAERKFKTQAEKDEYIKSALCVTIGPIPFKIEGKRWTVEKGYLSIPSMAQSGPRYWRQLVENIKNTNETVVKRQTVNGSKCYLLEASAKDYSLSIYFDPANDYNICRSRHLLKTPKGGDTQIDLKNVKFKTINGISVPVEWDLFSKTKGLDGHWSSNKHYVKRTKMIIDPDHEKLKSFVPDAPNGWAVRIAGFKGFDKQTHLKWINGAAVYDNGNKIDLDKLVKKPKTADK